jgi:hypothetical protein
MPTYKLSPSILTLMEECPRCFWLHFHGKQRPAGIFPSLPSGMDSILKTHFDKFMERGILPPELRESKDCKEMKLFDDKEKLKEWRNNFKGISWTDEQGNVLHGAVDNLLVKGNKIIVLDYKTRGFPLKRDSHEHYQNQLNIYNFLLRKNGYETEDYAFLLFYVPKEVAETGEVIFDTKLIKMKINVKDAERTWKLALKVLCGPCPPKHEGGSEEKEICEWCDLLGEE